jgi:formylglycine-generating enzyme required for sulfatase activity
MTCFLKVNGTMWLNELATQRFAPGTHTLTWLPGGDWGDRDFGQIVAYVRASDTGRCAPGRFLVIDLSVGANATSYPKEYKDFVDVRQDVYKTDKLVLRELPNGSWAGVFEVTQRQYQLVTGLPPSSFNGNPKRPVEQVSWNDLNNPSGFIDRIRTRTGLAGLGVPEANVWEYACRAGATKTYPDYSLNRGAGDDAVGTLGILGWYEANSGNRTHDVGESQPNAWGLCDALGNVLELTITVSGSSRIWCGGSYGSFASVTTPSERCGYVPDLRAQNHGFRLFLPPGRQ